MTKEPILSFRNLSKQFPGVLAVSNASLDIYPGVVHAVVGGNGAGKSTLMKMLCGIFPAGDYEGEITLQNELCSFRNIKEAEKRGIVMIPQELNMANDLSVAENLVLDKYPNRFGIVNHFEMFDVAQKIIDDFGLNVHPSKKVGEIGIAQKQLIVIARAMYNDVKVLLLDEPTATLSETECKLLFEKIGTLKERGIACIYISHKLEEVKEISDIVTVMRNGEIVGTDSNDKMSEQRIVSLMVGRELNEIYPPHDRTQGKLALRVNNITVYDPLVPGHKIVDRISFDLHEGEVLSVYGLVGAGRTEMALAMMGAYGGIVECDIELYGEKKAFMSPNEAFNGKMNYLPEDRKRHGVIDRLSVGTNISASALNQLSKFGLLDQIKEQEVVDSMIEALSIKTNSSETLVQMLSGGNQQKCVLARLIATSPNIIIMDEATQGVDIEAKSQIYAIMDNLAKEGKAILFISSDLSEVIGISDRIMVMRNGKIVNITDGKVAKRSKILWEATVGGEEENHENND